jgi:hypothetical protein
MSERDRDHPGQGTTAPPQPPDVTRWALAASVGIFVVGFTTMLVMAILDGRSDAQEAVFETCKWLTALSAMAIIGLLRR